MAKKREANFGTLFRHWLRANADVIPTGAYELKQTTSNCWPFGSVESHQLDYADAIKNGPGVLIRVQGVNGEPDYIWMRKEPAYIVIKYPNCFAIIDVNVLIREKTESSRRTLTSSRAKEIAAIYVEI